MSPTPHGGTRPPFPMNRGKQFETEIRSAMERKYPTGYVQKNGDNMTFRAGMTGPMPLPSPPDLLVTTRDWHALIECKAAKFQPGRMPSISLDAVKEHQLFDMVAFHNVSKNHHGIVAVCFYDGIARNRGGVCRAWFVSAWQWHQWVHTSGRKSANLDMIESSESRELIWIRGEGWTF